MSSQVRFVGSFRFKPRLGEIVKAVITRDLNALIEPQNGQELKLQRSLAVEFDLISVSSHYCDESACGFFEKYKDNFQEFCFYVYLIGDPDFQIQYNEKIL
ncbi:MAG: hypothetical protein WCE94_15305 [Candidatus Methanoperedens sp.]